MQLNTLYGLATAEVKSNFHASAVIILKIWICVLILGCCLEW